MGGLLHLAQRGGTWAGCGPAQAPPRCTTHQWPLYQLHIIRCGTVTIRGLTLSGINVCCVLLSSHLDLVEFELEAEQFSQYG